MAVIYKIQNKINNKVYIGQTHNFKKRYRSYLKGPFNKNNKEYYRPIFSAIRKYGIDNFIFTIIENIPENKDQQYIDERERYYIKINKSLVNENGYNVSLGGASGKRVKKDFEERIKNSSIFSSEEIIDIQEMLVNDYEFSDIINKYKNRLSRTYLSNINCGLNFNNPDLSYPLQKANKSSNFTKKEIELIKQDIKNGITYSKIQEKYHIKSPGFISGINTGKYYFNKDEKYPLCDKSRYGKNQVVVDKIINDLLNTNLSMSEIARKNDRSLSTVKNINYGRSHKNNNLSYPLRKK